jgi:hypothetical protein
MKSVGWALIVLPQGRFALTTEQGVAVGVGVGVGVRGVGVAVGVAVGVGDGVPHGVSVYCWLSFVGVPGAEVPATA